MTSDGQRWRESFLPRGRSGLVQGRWHSLAEQVAETGKSSHLHIGQLLFASLRFGLGISNLDDDHGHTKVHTSDVGCGAQLTLALVQKDLARCYHRA